MSQKNSLSKMILLGLLVILLAIVYTTHRTSRNAAPAVGSNNPSSNNVAQSSAQATGLSNPNAPSVQESTTNILSQTSGLPTENSAASNGKNQHGQPAQVNATAAQAGNNAGNTRAAQNKTNNPGNIANPIPTDAEVLQRIASRNQQEAHLYSILAAREALAAQVQQQASAFKYQTATFSNTPSAGVTPPSTDTIAKIKSFQLGASH
jgi:hypothetical protein